MSQLRDIPIVLFGGGAYVFGVDAGQIISIRQEPFDDDIPVEELLRLEPSRSLDRQTLNLRGYSSPTSVSVSRPVTIERIKAEAIFPLPVLVSQRIIIAGTKAMAFFDNRALLLVDLNAALNDLRRRNRKERRASHEKAQ